MAELIRPPCFYEPFAGGAAAFFHTRWPSAVIGDINADLIACYQGLAESPSLVRKKLARLAVDRATYERVRVWHPRSNTGAAARLLYLNRVGYGGIYRVNRAGIYNVPYAGDRSLTTILQDARLEKAAALLAEADVRPGDFDEIVRMAGPSDLVYCDPPYVVPAVGERFARYSHLPFTWADQERLARSLAKVVSSGAVAIVSNSAEPPVRDLYPTSLCLPIVRNSTLGAAGHREMKECIYVLAPDSSTAEDVMGHLVGALGL